jgi:hypothetical protein
MFQREIVLTFWCFLDSISSTLWSAIMLECDVCSKNSSLILLGHAPIFKFYFPFKIIILANYLSQLSFLYYYYQLFMLSGRREELSVDHGGST